VDSELGKARQWSRMPEGWPGEHILVVSLIERVVDIMIGI
jgi:hypothetical protein